MTRPVRKFKQDRLTYAGASAEEIRCDYAVAPFDRMAREMERKWGIERLPSLVSIPTADRWGLAMANLNAAIDACDVELVKARVAACLRGFAAMDAEATAAGHKPIEPELWEGEVDGFHFTLIRDDAAWPAMPGPPRRVFTMREVGLALQAYGQNVIAVKDAFPGATVTAIRPAKSPLADELSDEIPF